MEPVSMVVGVVLLAGGFLTGWLSRARRGPKPAPPLRPWCTCDHPLSSHDPKTAVCQTQDKALFRDMPGGASRDVWVRCPCVRYVGPEPLPPELYSPQFLDPRWHAAKPSQQPAPPAVKGE